MKNALQFKQSQQLVLTPQLRQSIRLLQMSTFDLEQEIEKALQENPLLERADGGEAESDDEKPAPSEESPTLSFSDPDESWTSGEANYASSPRSPDDESEGFRDFRAVATSLREHLSMQLGLMNLSSLDRRLVQCLIDSVDDDGYLDHSLEALFEAVPDELWGDAEEWQIALTRLQNFDPIGVGARDARECLLLQLKALPENEGKRLATEIVKKHLELLAAHDFARLKKLLACSDEALRDAQSVILSLNPRPGSAFSDADVSYITPDVVVKKIRGQWTASVNAAAFPRLRVNSLYAEILSNHRGTGLAGHLQEARWMIKNISQRFETICRVAQEIIERQRQFFEYGEVAMRPLVLREIADTLGLHESTVSRVTTQKYMATPRGLFELKYFFGSHVATDAGGSCSATAIRALIKQLVAAEDPKKPLSDHKISEILGQQGIVVARRTIAKYREAMSIPTVKLRKRF